jgi:DNA-directed RNA polymerase subunit RPC12/RpoP/outer membrane protein assembly factor BamB
MDMISVDCPNCGASLPHQQPGGDYRCSYCGSAFRLEQAKKAHTQQGMAIDPHALAQAIVAAQRQAQFQQAPPVQHFVPPPSKPAGNRVALFIVLAIMMAGAVPLCIALVGGGAAVLLSGGLLDNENVLWDDVGGVPQVVTVNGKSAVVGRTRAVGNEDHLYCGVYDTSAGKIWRTESLGTYMGGYQSTFCGAVGDALIATDQQARVQIFELATGAQRKVIELSDVVDYLCVPQDQSNQVWIKQLDERTHLLDPATGELTPSPQPEWCYESRHYAQTALQGGGSWADANAEGAPQVDKLKIEFVFQRNGKAVALGHTEPGTKVPTAVGFDPASKRVIWQQATPSVAKSTVRDADKFGAIAGDKFVTTYGAGQEDWYITALDIGTGERVWETKLRPIFAVDWIVGMVASDTHAFVVRTSSLEIFDARTGELTGTIGKETYD